MISFFKRNAVVKLPDASTIDVLSTARDAATNFRDHHAEQIAILDDIINHSCERRSQHQQAHDALCEAIMHMDGTSFDFTPDMADELDIATTEFVADQFKLSDGFVEPTKSLPTIDTRGTIEAVKKAQKHGML